MWNLLWALAGLLVVLWILGMVFHFTMGGLIHILLALAVIAVGARIVMSTRHHRTA